MDFWVGTVGLVVLGFFEVVLFGWIVGAERGITEANRGSDLEVPGAVALLIRWVCPAYLAFLLGHFAWSSITDQVDTAVSSPGGVIAILYLAAVFATFAVLAEIAARRSPSREVPGS